jgi:hypothetical protein
MCDEHVGFEEMPQEPKFGVIDNLPYANHTLNLALTAALNSNQTNESHGQSPYGS